MSPLSRLTSVARRARRSALGVGSGALMAAAGVPGPRVVPPDLPSDGVRVLFLHHSVGRRIWAGGVPEWFEDYNAEHDTPIHVVERSYPDRPYPWRNDPADYARLWARDSRRFRDQPSLAEIADAYDVVVVKHCYTASSMVPDRGLRSRLPRARTLANYRRHYAELRQAMLRHPDTQFLLWTVPPLTAASTSAEQTALVESFTTWVTQEWVRPGDNIHIWDYRALAARDGVLPEEYASGPRDSHPADEFARRAAGDLCERIVEVARASRTRG